MTMEQFSMALGKFPGQLKKEIKPTSFVIEMLGLWA